MSENYRNFSVRKRQWWITYICMVFNTNQIRGGDKHWRPDRPTSVFLFQSSFGFLKYCHGKSSEAENILRKIKMEFNQPLGLI